MKTRNVLLSLISLLSAMSLNATLKTETVRYEDGQKKFESTVVYHADREEPAPLVLIYPDWKGPREYFDEMAHKVAEMGFNTFVVDIYGADIRPESTEEASKATQPYREDRVLFQNRGKKALEVARSLDYLSTKRVAAIGFCFGGTGVLELARSGADVAGVVSFHGGLSNPNPENVEKIQAELLILHGARDPLVSNEEIEAFKARLIPSEVDWTFVAFSKAFHAFSDPNAHMPGTAEYNERAAKQSWEITESFLKRVLEVE